MWDDYEQIYFAKTQAGTNHWIQPEKNYTDDVGKPLLTDLHSFLVDKFPFGSYPIILKNRELRGAWVAQC